MTKIGKRELVLAIRLRYLRAGKAEKGRILDEFVATTGYHRKYAIWLSEAWPRSATDWLPPCPYRLRPGGQAGPDPSLGDLRSPLLASTPSLLA